jgi:hypothetical protein
VLAGGSEKAPPNKPLQQTAARRRDHYPFLSPVVDYHGLARRHLLPLRLLMRPQLNGGTLDGPKLGGIAP